MAEIANIIKKIATEGQKITTYPAKVIRVNREEGATLHDESDAYSVDIMRTDGAEIPHVRLKASVQDKEQGIICIPKVNSWVLVSIIETTETRAFISQYSEIEKIFLRIRKDDQYMQMQTDVDTASLAFKSLVSPGNPETNTAPTYKDISSLTFASDKSLNIKFWDDQEEKVTQETTIAHDQVKIDFDEGAGYQALVDSSKVQFDHSDNDLHFKMQKRFTVKVGEFDLNEQLGKLIDEVSKIVVVQGTSPNVGELMTIKNNICSILKEDK